MEANSIDLSLIIPCFNEAGSIPALVADCASIQNCEFKIQFVLINNGSTDNSESLLKLHSTILQNVKIVSVPQNLGYGGGLLLGIKNCDSTVIGWTHADLQTPINDVLIGLREYKKYLPQKVLLKGRRVGRPWLDWLFTKLMSITVWIFTGAYLSEINAQPKIFSADLLADSQNNCPTDFSFDLFVLLEAKRAGLIFDFPVNFKNRKFDSAKGAGGSLTQKLKVSLRTLKFLMRGHFGK